MKDLQIDSKGDLIISNHDLQLVRDKNLTAQKVRLVLSTNKGEWLLNDDEGINFRAILVKNPNEDEVLDIVMDGLNQIDDTFRITEYEFETIQRHLVLKFTAVNDSEEELKLVVGEAETKDNVSVLVCALTSDEVLKAGNSLSALSICNTDSSVLDCEV